MSIDINVHDPEPEVLPKKTKVECCIINYTSLRNFTDEPPQQHLLPGLGGKVAKPCSQRKKKELLMRE